MKMNFRDKNIFVWKLAMFGTHMCSYLSFHRKNFIDDDFISQIATAGLDTNSCPIARGNQFWVGAGTKLQTMGKCFHLHNCDRPVILDKAL